MITNEILSKINSCLDEKFQTDTFSDYLKNGEAKAANLLSVLTQITDAFDPESSSETFEPLTDPIVNAIIGSSEGLSRDTCITLNEGFCTLGDVADAMNSGMTDYLNGTIGSIDNVSFNVRDASGNIISEGATIAEAVESLKMTIASSAMERAAIEASFEDNISDKLSKFDALASQSVDVNNSNFKSACSYYKALLINKLPASDIIKRVFDDSGVDQLDDEEPVVMNDFDITAYTGASPLGSLSFNCLTDGIKTVGKVIGQVASAIGTCLSKIGSWVYGKVSKFTRETFTNPYDIIDNGNDNDSPCFEGFQYQSTYSSVHALWNSNRFSSDERATIASALNGKNDSWYTFKTVGGEIAMKTSSWEWKYVDIEPTYDWHLTVSCTVLFKPYSLAEFLEASNSGYSVNEFTEALNTYTGERYLNAKSDEHVLLNGFINGAAVTAGILRAYSLLCWNNSATLDNVKVFPSSFTHYEEGSVTNRDVLNVACGAYESDGATSFNRFPKAFKVSNNSLTGWVTTSLIEMAGDYATIIAYHYVNQITNESSNAYQYVPFCHGTQGMSKGRFGIKTDSTNQRIATILAGVLIAIAIVVVVVVTGVVLAKKIAKKNFWKRTEFVGRCDNTMWNNGTLTASDRRKYIRYQRKLNASNMLTKGISAAEVAENISSNSPVQDLYQSIMGTSNDNEATTLNQIKSILV